MDEQVGLLLPLVATSRPAARLRMTQYRGVVTATMCYDAHPIHDVFRRVDDDLDIPDFLK